MAQSDGSSGGNGGVLGSIPKPASVYRSTPRVTQAEFGNQRDATSIDD